MTPSGAVYICIKQFNARLGDELSLKVGDKLEVLADDSEYNDGWYMGKNIVSSEVGLYPKLFTQVLQEQAPGNLLRSRSRKVGTKKSLPQTPGTISQSGSTTTLGNFEYSANSTMSEIDKALKELQVNSFDSSSHDTSSHYENGDDENPLSTKKVFNNGNGPSTRSASITTHSTISTGTHSTSATSPANFPVSPFPSNSATSSTLPAQSSTLAGQSGAPPITSNGSGTARHLRNPSTQSLTEDLNPLKAAEWTPQQVLLYFAIVLGFDLDIAGKFARHKITGAILFQLDLAHLKELEIDSFGTRFEIHKEIEKLRQISSRNQKHKTMSRSNSTMKQEISKTTIPENLLKESIKEKSPLTKEPPIKEATIKEGTRENKAPSREYTRRDPGTPRDYTTRDPGTPREYTTTDPGTPRDYFTRDPGSSLRDMYSSPDRMGRSTSQLMPSASLKTHQRKRSQSLDEKRNSVLFSPEAFALPRKAPEPPAQPSPINRGYKFGGSLSPDPNSYITRTNASVGGSRPASLIYDVSVASHSRNISNSLNGQTQHRRNSSAVSGTHNNRHSGFFLFLTGTGDDKKNKLHSTNLYRDNLDLENSLDNSDSDSEEIATDITANNSGFGKLISPAKLKRENLLVPSPKDESPILSPKQRGSALDDSAEDIAAFNALPKKLKSVSYREKKEDRKSDLKEERRSTSDTSPAVQISRLKTLRTTSTQNFRNLTQSKKLKTSAFQEGIRDCSAEEATKDSNYSGWMSKRSGNSLSWRSRYFALHGTRLSYFTSFKDKKEKGLIDITAHKVIPINPDQETGNDKYIAMYALSTGYGRFCFKVVPPAPGFKKGLTFTQPKTHYFAVDTIEEMRGWLKALMVATIDIDDTVPVVSSCSTPTVSLAKAQELLAKAREETRLKDEELRAKGYLRDGLNGTNILTNGANNNSTNGTNNNSTNGTTNNGTNGTANGTSTNSNLPPIPSNNITGFGLDSDYGQYLNELNSDIQTSLDSNNSPNIDSVGETTVSSIPLKPTHPKLSIDTAGAAKNMKAPSTPLLSLPSTNGFASPYLLASGLLSPKLANSSPAKTPGSSHTGDYFEEKHTETTPKRGSRKKNSEKMLAYTSDGSGNHTFVIKQRK